jgi:hypothetical protein
MDDTDRLHASPPTRSSGKRSLMDVFLDSNAPPIDWLLLVAHPASPRRIVEKK